MNTESSDSSWSKKWRDHLADMDESFTEEADLIKDSSSATSKHSDSAFRNLASSAPDPAALLVQLIGNSVNYSGVSKSDASLHLASSASTETSPHEVNIEHGEMIQLDPALNPLWGRPVYGLIIGSNETEFTLVPFSAIDIPATEGELLTGLGESGLKVLCAWNVTQLPKKLLYRHFKLDVASDQLLEDLSSLIRSLQNREEIPESLAERVGPSPFGLSPEKLEYLDQEERLFEKLLNP
ncbi:MAG: hypothetical protein AAF357_20085 [Verrucomicrobiota bacterium]